MRYQDKTFSVAAPGTDSYREGWDRIFKKSGQIGPLDGPKALIYCDDPTCECHDGDEPSIDQDDES